MKWLAFLLAAHACAASLADLQSTANKLRVQRSRPPGSRGESRLLTEFKDQLREWAESQITGEIANPRSLQDQLNRTLAGAGLMCSPACDDQNELGYLGELQLDPLAESPGWLVLKTSVGIVCGNDESVYIYQRAAGKWLRRFESEQDQMGEGNYTPQEGVEVQSVVDSTRRRLVFTSGVSPGCASSWQIGYFRLFRLEDRRPLMDRQHTVYLGEEEQTRLLADELLVRRFGFSLHYKIEGDQLRRIEPLAPGPAAFVDEWRASPWSEVAEWSTSSLASWHAMVKEPHLIFGLWDSVTLCLKRPGQWQIEAEIDHEAVYFLVEERVERAPSSYRMLDVSTDAHSGCEP